MKERILDLVNKYEHVSFIELCQKIPGFSGDYIFKNSKLENIVLWDGLSQEAVNIMAQLLSKQQIYINEVKPVVYLHDGGFIPTLPVANSIKSYKTPHWLPVTFTCKPPVK